jgi:hypothetical protein
MISPIITGCSGMVGEGVLLTALKSPDVDRILVLGRRSCGVTDPKLTELLHDDLYDLSAIEERLRGYNACFFCLGTTSFRKDEAEYTRVTYELTMTAARTLSRLNPEMTFCYVSGQGTDSTEKGRQMWARVKGRTENALARLPFKAAFAFRPGMMRPVKGQKNLKRFMRIGVRLYPVVKALAPFAVCELEEVGKAMINASLKGYEKPVLENSDISTLARR